jgi:hypothetical protein
MLLNYSVTFTLLEIKVNCFSLNTKLFNETFFYLFCSKRSVSSSKPFLVIFLLRLGDKNELRNLSGGGCRMTKKYTDRQTDKKKDKTEKTEKRKLDMKRHKERHKI